MLKLVDQHTKVLLQWLSRARATGGTFSPNDCDNFDADDIKKELSTREHVPNRQEAKKIRQEKARQGRHKQGV